MWKLNQAEIDILLAALGQAHASVKRMQISKPKFANIFQQEATDIVALQIKLQGQPQKP